LDLERGIFVLYDRTYTAGDVISAADFRGDLLAPWQSVLAWFARDESERHRDEEAIQSACNAFRVERDLISADETEKWLKQLCLSEKDFFDYFARRTALPAPRADATAVDYWNAATEWRHLLHVDLMISGEFEQMAQRLAWRIAAVDPDDVHLRSGNIDFATLEKNYQALRRKVASVEACQRVISLTGLQWTSYVCEVMEYDAAESRDFVDELLFCLREDCASMTEVGRHCGYAVREEVWNYECLDDDLRIRLPGARCGEIIGPIAFGDCPAVIRLIEKRDASLSDEAVRLRVERKVCEQHFSKLAAKRVRWTFPAQ